MDSWSQKWPQQNLSDNTKYLCFSINLPHLDLLLSVCLQLMADWTLVMLVCCWLRDEAPTRWLTCESSKVSLSRLGFGSVLVVFDDIILQLKWNFYYYKQSIVLKKTLGLGTSTEFNVLGRVSNRNATQTYWGPIWNIESTKVHWHNSHLQHFSKITLKLQLWLREVFLVLNQPSQGEWYSVVNRYTCAIRFNSIINYSLQNDPPPL